MIYNIKYPYDAGKKFTIFYYPAGESQVRLNESSVSKVKEADVINVVARITNGNIIPIAQLIDAVRGVAHTCELNLILPYLPYSRADRRFVEGDCAGLQIFGGILHSLSCDKIVTLDVHSEQATKLIPGLKNVSALPFIDRTLESLQISGRPVVLFPDEGAKRYNSLDGLHCAKNRDAETGELLGFNVPVKDAFEGYGSILIVDDICDGGRTFIGIAEKLKSYGLPLHLYVTHGIFSKGLKELDKYFDGIFTTDSFEQPKEKYVVYPCEGVILQNILTPSQLWGNAAAIQAER